MAAGQRGNDLEGKLEVSQQSRLVNAAGCIPCRANWSASMRHAVFRACLVATTASAILRVALPVAVSAAPEGPLDQHLYTMSGGRYLPHFSLASQTKGGSAFKAAPCTVHVTDLAGAAVLSTQPKASGLPSYCSFVPVTCGRA